jgi:curved DNA-binding protein CbpA
VADRTDYYAVLGVARTASAVEITRAYHRLVRLHHPDTRDAEAESDRLREVVAAYAVLRDPDRRAAYDRRFVRVEAGRARPRPRPGAEPMIRVGPVRYHGSTTPLDDPFTLLWRDLHEEWR